MATASTSWTVLVTEQFGGRLTHHVFDQHIAPEGAGGVLQTACGRWILPAPMMTPAGKHCAECALRFFPKTEPRRRRGWTWR